MYGRWCTPLLDQTGLSQALLSLVLTGHTCVLFITSVRTKPNFTILDVVLKKEPF